MIFQRENDLKFLVVHLGGFFFLKGLLIFSNCSFVVFDVSLSHFSVCFFFLSSAHNSETPDRKCSSWPFFPPEFRDFYLTESLFFRSLNNRRWDNKPIIPKKTQQTDLIFRHNQIFALFSSVAVQREQRKNQKQGNIYKDLSTATEEKRAKIWLWRKMRSVCCVFLGIINRKSVVFEL